MSENNKTKNYLKRYLNEVIYSQAFSEGIAATFPETERLLSGKSVDNVSPNDIEVILSLKRAWNYIYENLGNQFYFEDIALLNAIVSDSTNLQPGKLRIDEVYIRDKNGERWYPNLPNELEVKENIYRINKIKDPLERGLEQFAYFTKTQIFNNCNKRTAFLIANKTFLENNLGILYPSANNKNDLQYKETLVEYYKHDSNKNDLFEFLLSNNFHNYELDAIRKEYKSENIPLDIVKSTISSKEHPQSRKKQSVHEM